MRGLEEQLCVVFQLYFSLKTNLVTGGPDYFANSTRDFITAQTSVTLSVTPNAAYQRARYADAKKRKRACLEAEAADDEESTTRGVSVPVLKTHTTY